MDLFDNSNHLLQQFYTSSTGEYSFNTGLGTYAVKADLTNVPFAALCPASNNHASVLTAIDSTDYGADFRLVCKPGYDLGVKAISVGWRSFAPNRTRTVNIDAGDMASLYGVLCNRIGIGGTLKATFSGPVTYQGVVASGIPASLSGNTVTWTVTDFSTVDFNKSFGLNLKTDSLATIGSQVCIDVTISGSTGMDNNLSNNTLTRCFIVANSFDPNGKEVYPSEIHSTNEWLMYTIRFQNTGSAVAQDVQLIDTLDTNADISTFELLTSGHYNVTQVLEGGIVKFNFPNIDLVDSLSDEPHSHGSVEYRIKMKPGSPFGTAINNRASIYFDFNNSVVTNTTSTSLKQPNSVDETIEPAGLLIYPNPANQFFVVRTVYLENAKIAVTDLNGRIILTQTLTPGSDMVVSIENIATGAYFVQFIKDGKTVGSKKLLVV